MNEGRRGELAAAFSNGEMTSVKRLIKEGVLEEYYLGIYQSKESKTLEKINNKVQVAGMLLDLGLVVVPSHKYLKHYPSGKRLFNVTLIPGTDLIMDLLVNLTAVKVEVRANKGNIPLHIICSLPDVPPEVVELFLRASPADIDQKDGSNQVTALMIAAARGNLDVVRLLVDNGADVNATAFIPLVPEGRFGFHYDYMRLFSTKELKVRTIPAYFSALVAAVYEDEPQVLFYLIKSGADVNVRGHSWMALFHPAFNGRMEIVEILLKNGIDVNSKGVLGSTVLHIAVEKDDLEMAKLLLSYAADGNQTDDFGWTPLHVAALFSCNVSKDMIETLLDSGCDVNALTDGGYSPLNLAEAGHNLTFLSHLVKEFPNLNHIRPNKRFETVDFNEAHVEVIRMLLDRGADFDHHDSILGWSTLHWAAATGDLTVAKLLVEKYEAVTTRRSKQGLTPFRTAIEFGRKALSVFLNPDRNLVL